MRQRPRVTHQSRVLGAGLVIGVMAGQPADAHFQEILPDDDVLPKGDIVVLDLVFAHPKRCCRTLAVEGSHCESMQLDGLGEQAVALPDTARRTGPATPLRKRGSLLIWLDKGMTWLAPHDGSPGRPAIFSDAATLFCLTIRVLFKPPLRQATGMEAGLFKTANLDQAVPDYTTLCRRQKTLAVQVPYRRADGPLNFLIDSTGIKFPGDGEWRACAFGRDRGRRCQ